MQNEHDIIFAVKKINRKISSQINNS